MDLLDCGLPVVGTITSGLAEFSFRPDASSASISPKRRSKRAANDYSGPDFENLTFRQADVYELPFEDETFDAAFSHACPQQLC